MASAKIIAVAPEENKDENEKRIPLSNMSNENSINLNKPPPPSKESYWFAHGGGDNTFTNANLKSTDLKDLQLQKEREERIRIFKEQQEEERIKRLKELEQSFVHAKKYREQQEEERRRKIEEARNREMERRAQVEERKRQIWEAEQERKEAILRRNMEREARIEARRNAQRNSQSFAFGSSTPRTFDLDLAAIGIGRNTSQGSVLMSSISGRRSEERELGPPRATSACSLDRKFENFYDESYLNENRDYTRALSLEPPSRINLSKQIALQHKSSEDMKACLSMCDNNESSTTYVDNFPSGWLVGSGVLVGEDCMSRSMVSLSSTFRGRKRTDIMPAPARERSITPHITSRGKDSSRSPSRPQSSLSGASEVSAASSSISAVNMRPKTAPRRPRPISIAGTIVDRTQPLTSTPISKDNGRQPRLLERNNSNTVTKPTRMRSIGREKETQESAKPKKPIPPPKSSEVLSRAKSHPVPIKDNLRKIPKTDISTNSSQDMNPNLQAKPSEDIIIKVNNDALEPVKMINNSESKNTINEVKVKDTFKEAKVNDIANEAKVKDTINEAKVKDIINESKDIINESKEQENCQISNTVEISSYAHSNDTKELSNVAASKPEKPAEENIKESTLIQNNIKIDDKSQDTPATNIPNPENEDKNFEAKVSVTNIQESQNNTERENSTKEIPSKPRITSEEEAKAALAEKRRLAREQAEREAELERQRLEEIRRQEEEKKRAEELEQKRLEEEQIRLAELHRQLEEEKLRKAIEEKEQREREERERKEEEARQKAEKEEQERKAREEAERQRIELEERLKKEEEERAERKRRVEQIMARTRGKTSQSSTTNNTTDNNAKIIKESSTNSNTILQSQKLNKMESFNNANTSIVNGSLDSKLDNSLTSATENNVLNINSLSFSREMKTSLTGPLPDLLNSKSVSSNNNFTENGQHEENFISKRNATNNFNLEPNKIVSANDVLSPTQTNGYSSHEEMSCTTSPEEMGNSLIINLENQKSIKVTSESSDYNLLDLSDRNIPASNSYLIKVDEVNSNLINSNNSLIGFDDNLQKKQETSVTDLLS